MADNETQRTGKGNETPFYEGDGGKTQAQRDPRNQNPTNRSTDPRQEDSGGGSSSSRIVDTESGRLIFGLMFFATGFSLVGIELTEHQGAGKLVLSGPQVILGGFTGATILTLLSHAGEGGRQFAVGLATVTMVSSVLVFGAPVWKGLSNLLGSKPTTPLAESSATTPTHGTATGKALAQAA
jgi:hypothetical protein